MACRSSPSVRGSRHCCRRRRSEAPFRAAASCASSAAATPAALTFYAQLNREVLSLCANADFIVYKNAVLAAFGVAQKLGIPCAAVRLQPYTPTRAFPAFVLKGKADYGPLINRLSGAVLQAVVWRMLRNDALAFWREELRLPPPAFGYDDMLARAGAMVPHPISPRVLPARRTGRPTCA